MEKSLRIALGALFATLGCSNSDLYTGITHRNACEPACPSGARCSAGHCYTEPCSFANPCQAALTCVAGFCSDQSCDPLCASDQVCLAQVCVAPTPSPCEPDGGCAAPQHCTVGLCVDDTCSPGCGAGQVCLSGLCVPTSGGLTCASPYVSCTSGNGDPYCADLLRDASNCGACGKQCPSGELCNGAGLCAVSCVASEANCNGRCFDLGTDDQNCGACATDCGAGQVCSGGTCAASCAVPDVACGVGTASYCADTQLDPANCGGCGSECAYGQNCAGGSCLTSCGLNLTVCGTSCTDLQFDDVNCGACGATCGVNNRCLGSTCDRCGTLGQICCTDEGCDGSLTCADELCLNETVIGGAPVITLAGNGFEGWADGTGGYCSSAEFSHPKSIAIDEVGNVYVADMFNSRIRKIDPTGFAVTLAGNGQAGWADGTGGPSGTAEFKYPQGIATDSAGNVYVADTWNNCIRKIDPSGNVSTVAGNGDGGWADGSGGPTGSAQFNQPEGVAVDSLENLYIGDTLNHRLRKIDSAGNVTTLAGNGTPSRADGTGGPSGTAELDYPAGVAVAASGTIYVAEPNDGRIRSVDSQGNVTTLAGSGGPQGYSDGTGGPSGTAEFNQPQNLAVDSAGNVYVADVGNNRIRRIDIRGNVTTLAGSVAGNTDGTTGPAGTATFDGPAGIAVDQVGNIYVSDEDDNRIRKICLYQACSELPPDVVPIDGGIIVTTLAGAGDAGWFDGSGGPCGTALFSGPEGIAVDANGNVFVGDTGNNRVREIHSGGGGALATLAGNGASGYLDGSGGPSGTAEFLGLFGVAVDPQGNVYVADYGNNRIRRIDRTGSVTTLAGNGMAGFIDGAGGPSGAAEFNNPAGVAVDLLGNVYVADARNNRIRKIDPDGGVSTLAGNGSQTLSDGTGGPSGTAAFSLPYAVAVDDVGLVYVADTANNCVRKIDSAGNVTTLAGNGGYGFADGTGGPTGTAMINGPRGVAVDGVTGNVYVTSDNRVRKIDSAGNVTTLAGTDSAGYSDGIGGPLGSAELNLPYGVAVDSMGNVYIADAVNNRIRVIHP